MSENGGTEAVPEGRLSYSGPERREHPRHPVDSKVRLVLVKTGIGMPGRIVDLSLGGCRLRTDEQFRLGIYVRVETEFFLRGLPFRLAGVSQAILDKNTIGVRFLDMSDRKRKQLAELIAEIAQAEATAKGAEAEPPVTAESRETPLQSYE